MQHHIVTVTWADYLRHMGGLMQHKHSPLHPVEVGLYLAAQQAAADGVQTLVLGNGADSTFGGLDKLLSRDWTPAEFVARYTFVDPQQTLRAPADLWPVFAPYAHGEVFDTSASSRPSTVRVSFRRSTTPLGRGAAAPLSPTSACNLTARSTSPHIRQGESKYLLRSVFAQLYPALPQPRQNCLRPPHGCLAGRFATHAATSFGPT